MCVCVCLVGGKEGVNERRAAAATDAALPCSYLSTVRP